MEKEEKVVAEPESEKETVEIEDVDLGLTEKDVENVAAEVKKKVTEQHVLNPDQQKLFNEIMLEAKMPVKMKDSEFALGENELDIRYLSNKNREQMTFRQLCLQNVYLKQCLTSLIDVTRLLMVLADKFGVSDIVGATDEVIDKVVEANKIKEKLKTEDKNNKA